MTRVAMYKIAQYKKEQYYLYQTLVNGKVRWIECIGKEVSRDHSLFPIVEVVSPMGGIKTLIAPMTFVSRIECMFVKDKLNSEQVRKCEPDNWIITWQETYQRTHKEILNHN